MQHGARPTAPNRNAHQLLGRPLEGGSGRRRPRRVEARVRNLQLSPGAAASPTRAGDLLLAAAVLAVVAAVDR